MKKKLFYFLMLLVLSCNSCNTEESIKNQRGNLITDGSYKIWDLVKDPLYPEDLIRKSPFIFEYFNRDGRFYIGYFAKDSFIIEESDDIIIYHRWKLVTDTIINLDGGDFRIKKLTQDTFITELPNKSIFVYAKHKQD